MLAEERRAAALVKGRKLKRNNALTALACGALPGVLIARFWFQPSLLSWIAGIAIGMLWANAFEYFYHRYLLHLPKSWFGREHLLHHSTLGQAEEPEHITFGSSPLYLMILFETNGALALLLGWLLRLPIAPGILAGFSVYFVMVEEIHWRIHMGEWLPFLMDSVREYHMAHHDIPDGRFNVFFPVFDYVFGNIRPEIAQTEARTMAQSAMDSNEQASTLRSWEAALLWSWMMMISVGIRHFWNSVPK